MNGRIERDYATDIHLVQIRREIRKPLVNWYGVVGLGLCCLSAAFVIVLLLRIR